MPCFHPPASPPAPGAAMSAAMGRAPAPSAPQESYYYHYGAEGPYPARSGLALPCCPCTPPPASLLPARASAPFPPPARPRRLQAVGLLQLHAWCSDAVHAQAAGTCTPNRPGPASSVPTEDQQVQRRGGAHPLLGGARARLAAQARPRTRRHAARAAAMPGAAQRGRPVSAPPRPSAQPQRACDPAAASAAAGPAHGGGAPSGAAALAALGGRLDAHAGHLLLRPSPDHRPLGHVHARARDGATCICEGSDRCYPYCR